MDNLNIGHKIKKLRELRNLTQEHMASSLVLSQSAYSRMELGETEITFSKLEKISEELGMKPEEIIAFNESMVFNVMNNQTGNVLVINNNVPSEEAKESKTLYDQLLTQLKEENAHLKKIIENLLKLK